MKHVTFVVFNLLFLVNCNHEILHECTEFFETNKTAIPVEIIANYLHKYFDSEGVFLSISSSALEDEQKYFQEDLIDELVLNKKIANFSFNILVNKIDQFRQGNRNVFNLIFIDGEASMMKILNKFTVHPFHLYQQFLIFLTKNPRNISQDLHGIFGIALKMGLLEMNVLIEDTESEMWTIYSYIPYTPDCGSLSLRKIDIFSRENYTDDLKVPINGLFPPKKFKFHDCPLVVSTFSMEPFVILRNTSESGNIAYDGLDVTIVNQISKTLNLVPKYLQSPDKKGRGTLSKNGSATGAIKMVIDGDANMTIGTYAMNFERVAVMSPSLSYMQHSFIFAFVESIEMATPLAKLMAPFEENVWISLLVLLTIAIIIILLTKKLTRRQRHFVIGGRFNRTPIVNMFSSLMGNAIPNQLMTKWKYFGTFARTLTILWIFFWLVVRNAYQGALYEHFQSQRVSSLYDKVEKVRNSTVKINVFTAALPFIPVNFDTRRLIKHEQFSDETTGLQKISSGEWDGVFLTNDFIAGYFNSKSKTRIETTTDKVRIASPVFYFQKTSILTAMFNQKIERCQESGLILRWYTEYNQKQKKDRNKFPKKLEIVNILAMIQISAVLYLASIIIFIMELMSPKNKIIRRLLDFLTY